MGVDGDVGDAERFRSDILRFGASFAGLWICCRQSTFCERPKMAGHLRMDRRFDTLRLADCPADRNASKSRSYRLLLNHRTVRGARLV